MRPLYEIDNEILECVDTETGEIIDEKKLDALEMERSKKIEAVILWRKDIVAEKEAVKSEAAKLSKRGKTLENMESQLDQYIEKALNGEKFKTERCSVSYRRSKKVIIDDVSAIPNKYWKAPSDDWISKSAIKEDLEKGVLIGGTHIEERTGMIIR